MEHSHPEKEKKHYSSSTGQRQAQTGPMWLKNRCTDLPVSEHQSNKRVGSKWKKCCLINIQSMCSSDAAHFIGVTIVLWSCCCKTSLATANCFTVNVRETWVGPIITNAWKPDLKNWQSRCGCWDSDLLYLLLKKTLTPVIYLLKIVINSKYASNWQGR